MNIPKIIGWNVKRLRIAQGLSQEELAFRVEVINQAYISELERGKRNPTSILLALIAKGLSTECGELFSTKGIQHEWVEGPIEIRSIRTGKEAV